MLIDLNELRMNVYQFLKFPSCLCNNITYIRLKFFELFEWEGGLNVCPKIYSILLNKGAYFSMLNTKYIEEIAN